MQLYLAYLLTVPPLSQLLIQYIYQMALNILAIFRRRPLLTAAALIGVLAASIPAYRDYQLYLSYGPGGIPHNAFGWFVARCLLTPFTQEMLGTDVYQQKINHGATTSYIVPNGKLPRRSGTNPTMAPHVVPQRQITQFPDDEMKRVCMTH
jgi:hypothetical protein